MESRPPGLRHSCPHGRAQYPHKGPPPKRWTGVWWTKCQMQRPTKPNAHSSTLEASMISFCTAQGLPHTHIKPEFLTQLAPATKHASSGPRDVANMPAPHGQCAVLTLSSLPRLVVLMFLYTSFSIISMFLVAMTASSSPGYEIFGMGGTGQSSGFLPCSSTQ